MIRVIVAGALAVFLAAHGARAENTMDDAEGAKKELAGLQGTWQCKAGESNGKDDGRDAPKLWVVVFDKNKMIYKENGKVVAEGDLEIDATKSPKHITARFTTLNQTDVMIFFRVGDVLVLCGHRDGKTRPTQFATGTEGGGAFLTAWQRVK